MEFAEHEVKALLEAWATAARARRGRLAQTSLSAEHLGQLPQTHSWEERGMRLKLDEKPGVAMKLHFRGHGEQWRGALLHFFWPAREAMEEGPVSGFVRLSTEPYDECYDGIVSGPCPRLLSAPAWAPLIPRTVDPERILPEMLQATFRPTRAMLEGWCGQHKDAFKPEFRGTWDAVLLKLPA